LRERSINSLVMAITRRANQLVHQYGKRSGRASGQTWAAVLRNRGECVAYG
jgi:hypothetical protein